MIDVAEAWSLIDTHTPPPSFETLFLDAASGRISGDDIVAPEDLPPFSRSAMDGYLVRRDETSRALELTGEVRAGDEAKLPPAGCTIRISTGGAVPDQNAAVIRQEDVTVEGTTVTIPITPDARHVRSRGSHARAGTTLITAGTVLNPGAIGLLASVGVCEPRVATRIPTCHLATGREIVPATETPGTGCIRDANSPMIAALVQNQNGTMISHALLPDDPGALHEPISQALAAGARLLLISGGASVGDHDHTRPALRAAGFELLFAGVAVKPGKPIVFARRDDTVAFALPGNPLSHFVCFHLFVRRAMARMSGIEPAPLFRVKAPDELPRLRDQRETWWPCAFDPGSSTVDLASWQDSSDLRPLASANALVRIPSLADGPDPDKLDMLAL